MTNATFNHQGPGGHLGRRDDAQAAVRIERQQSISVTIIAVIAALALLGITAGHPPAAAGPRAHQMRHTARSNPLEGPLACTLRGSWVSLSPDVDGSGDGLQWSRTDLCNDAIARFLHPERARSWVLLGDSTMGRLWEWGIMQQMRPGWSSPGCKVLNSSGRCDMLAYLGFPRAAHWNPPQRSREGPGVSTYGSEHPFCITASAKYAVKEACDGHEPGAIDMVTVEYLPVQQARDVELQSPTTPTTQDTVAAYYEQQQQQDVCILNTGLHEADLMPEISDLTYVANVHHYVGLLARHCRAMLWLSTSKTRDDVLEKQSNTHISRRNGMVRAMLQERHRAVFFLDLWALSDVPKNSTLRDDNVHFKGAYYRALGRYLYTRIQRGN